MGATQLLRTRPDTLVTKKGATGEAVKLMTNYFRLNAASFHVFQWRVDFEPEEDHTRMRKALFYQLKSKLGVFLFDGTMMFNMNRLSPDNSVPMTFTVQSREGANYTVTIKFVGEIVRSDFQFIHICNIIMRQCMDGLKMTLLGRNYFDSEARQILPDWKLEVWPGYVTSIRQHENELLLCCEPSNKIIRTDSVYDQMKLLRGRSGNFQADVQRLLLGQIIMTRYNNKTYKIDDIDFKQTPKHTFPKKDGTEISYLEYYTNRYKLKIHDTEQPLLVSRPRDVQRRSDGADQQPVILIPELCNMTGLSDDQRANFKLMKALGEYTRPEPPKRVRTLNTFAKRMTTTAESKKTMTDWNLDLQTDLVKLQGRVFKPETILQGGKKTCSYSLDNADWGSAFRDFKLFNTVNCSKWGVIFGPRDEQETAQFVQLLVKCAPAMGFLLNTPQRFPISDTRTPTYVQKLKIVTAMRPQLVMIVTPNNKGDAYSAIKKVCCVEDPTVSQVVTGTVLRKPKGLMSVATKVAVQMASKLGAEPWGVQIPLKDTMVMGYDSYHDTLDKSKSVGALVSTLNKSMTRFTSSCTVHANKEELHVQLKLAFIKALRQYSECNGKALPQRIIVYRDGVGEGQIEFVKQDEIQMLKSAIKENFNYDPMFTFIIVSKRINTRFFKDNNGSAPTNPTSGTVIDDIVTLPERYDFFIVSQSVRQGTVNPTSYNVIEDTSGLRPDHIQMLTYKLTHLYYNWPGTVRVPCVCQYAHKLAYLVGESIHRKPSDMLENLLYYL